MRQRIGSVVCVAAALTLVAGSAAASADHEFARIHKTISRQSHSPIRPRSSVNRTGYAMSAPTSGSGAPRRTRGTTTASVSSTSQTRTARPRSPTPPATGPRRHRRLGEHPRTSLELEGPPPVVRQPDRPRRLRSVHVFDVTISDPSRGLSRAADALAHHDHRRRLQRKPHRLQQQLEPRAVDGTRPNDGPGRRLHGRDRGAARPRERQPHPSRRTRRTDHRRAHGCRRRRSWVWSTRSSGQRRLHQRVGHRRQRHTRGSPEDPRSCSPS
jgi:hypothetical protein